ncbi:DUF1554 domain-containing protein [Leptospira meyeri]|uniref:DUF1554 domain-containing protein n=1 Tax=Leptospira meyeri TaxID=29508 RepID=UPI0014384E3B|nr:DUF1554 domain-containing protein [Leptospira meyeri]
MVGFSFLCLFCFISCKPADLCNAADASSECGILQFANPKTSSSSEVRTPRCSSCKLFVTATAYNANLGGIAGADNKCSSDPNKPATGTYKALLVDDVNRRACTSINCTTGGIMEQIDWVLAPNASYESLNTSNFIFTSDGSGVFNNNLTNPFSAATGIWTGIKNNPSWDWQTDTSHTCSSWTDSITTNCGTYGVTSWTDSRSIAITSAYGSGGTLNNLICVEQ